MPKNIAKIIQLLEKEHGTESWNWHTQQSLFQVLIGTVLSQRTKDANTDKAAQQLFSKYRSPKSLAKAPIKDIERRIKPSGFYKVKARRIKEISKILLKNMGARFQTILKNWSRSLALAIKPLAV